MRGRKKLPFKKKSKKKSNGKKQKFIDTPYGRIPVNDGGSIYGF